MGKLAALSSGFRTRRPRPVPSSAAVVISRSQQLAQRDINTFYSPTELDRRVGTPHTQLKDVVSSLVTRHARHVGLVVFKVNILARPVGPGAKTTEFMTIETRSVKKKSDMGKSTTDLPIQTPRQNSSQAQNPLVVVTPESTSATRQEKEIGLDGQP